MSVTLGGLNNGSAGEFVAALDGMFEHAPWVAEAAAGRRPFATVAALHEGLMEAARTAPETVILGLFNAHPELAPGKLPAGLTAESDAEQAWLGMGDAADASALPALNSAYRERFGFPFIICVARHTAEDVLRTLRARLERDPASEFDAALNEIERITRLRLLARVEGPGAPRIEGHFSTHVLNTVEGRPASGLLVGLLQEGRAVAQARTDADGRASGLLPPGPLRQGRYELQFDAGGYFSARGQASFYDRIPVRFVIGEAESRYHIPLLLAPFAYSTYRGS